MSGPGVDPVGAGLIENLARPGGNVTGVTHYSGRTRRQAAGAVQRSRSQTLPVSRFSYNPATPASALDVKEVLPAAARALRVDYSTLGDTSSRRISRRSSAALNKERPDGLCVSPGAPLTIANRKRIADFALKSRLPSMYVRREFVEAGGLMSYSADLVDSYRRVAYYVDRILKGAKPAELPVEQPTKFELVDQSEDSEADRIDDSTECFSAGGSGDQMTGLSTKQ